MSNPGKYNWSFNCVRARARISLARHQNGILQGNEAMRQWGNEAMRAMRACVSAKDTWASSSTNTHTHTHKHKHKQTHTQKNMEGCEKTHSLSSTWGYGKNNNPPPLPSTSLPPSSPPPLPSVLVCTHRQALLYGSDVFTIAERPWLGLAL